MFFPNIWYYHCRRWEKWKWIRWSLRPHYFRCLKKKIFLALYLLFKNKLHILTRFFFKAFQGEHFKCFCGLSSLCCTLSATTRLFLIWGWGGFSTFVSLYSDSVNVKLWLSTKISNDWITTGNRATHCSFSAFMLMFFAT